MVKDNRCEPYVSEVEVFRGSDLAKAVKKAVKAGYNYYVEGDLNSHTADYELLAYNRTKDKDRAVTSLIGSKEEKDHMIYKKINMTL